MVTMAVSTASRGKMKRCIDWLTEFFLLLAAAAPAPVPVVNVVDNVFDKRLKLTAYCNAGTDGDGGCEKLGLNTYCV